VYHVIFNILNRPLRATAQNPAQIQPKTPIGMDSPGLRSLSQHCFPRFCKRLYYERMVQNGMITSNARHAVARKMLTAMWAMWKTNSPFDESLVFLSN